MNENDTTINSPAEPYDAGAEIVKMLIKHPERADELEEEDWQELDGDQWADLIEARPAFRSRGPWELSSWDWGRFFARLPDRLEAYPAFRRVTSLPSGRVSSPGNRSLRRNVRGTS